MSKKNCSRCGKRKALNAFYKQKGGAQGRRGMCKECYRAAERASGLETRRFSSAGGRLSSGGRRKVYTIPRSLRGRLITLVSWATVPPWGATL
jgi:hypothetical protein